MESEFATYASGAFGEHHHAVCKLCRFFDVMGNQDNRARAFAQHLAQARASYASG